MSFLAIQFPSIQLLANELLAVSLSNSLAHTHISAAYSMEMHMQLHSMRRVICCDYLKGSNVFQGQKKESFIVLNT